MTPAEDEALKELRGALAEALQGSTLPQSSLGRRSLADRPRDGRLNHRVRRPRQVPQGPRWKCHRRPDNAPQNPSSNPPPLLAVSMAVRYTDTRNVVATRL